MLDNSSPIPTKRIIIEIRIGYYWFNYLLPGFEDFFVHHRTSEGGSRATILVWENGEVRAR